MRILRGHSRSVRAVAFAPCDAATLATAGDDGRVQLWNPGTGENWGTLGARRGGVLALAFSPDGGLLADGRRDGGVRVWDVALLRLHQHLPLGHGPVFHIAFAPGGATVLAAPRNHAAVPGDPGLLLWCSVNVRKAPERLEWPSAIQCVALAPGGGALAAADEHRGVELWTLALSRRQTVLRFAHRVRCLAFSPEPSGRTLAVGGGRVVECWDVGGVQRRSVCKGHRLPVRAVAFGPDGRTLLSGSADRTVRLWDVGSGRELAAWDWEVGPVQTLAYAPDGMTAAVGGEKGEVVVWDLD